MFRPNGLFSMPRCHVESFWIAFYIFSEYIYIDHIYRARLKRTIREAKRIFYAGTFVLYKNDMRITWGTLQSDHRTKGQSEFIFGNHIIRDSDEITNHFNDYFINISRTLSQQIQPVSSFEL